jgi:hypothetical protein
MHEIAVRQHRFHREHMVNGETVLQAVRAAGVFRHVAANRAHLLTGRIRRVVKAMRGDLTCDLEIGDAGLDGDTAVRNVDIENTIQSRETDEQPAWNRQRPSRQSAAVATRHERDVMTMAEAHHRLHLFGRRWEDDGRRSVTEVRKPITLVGQKFQWFGDHSGVADDAAQLRDERGPERVRAARGRVHAATPSADSYTS